MTLVELITIYGNVYKNIATNFASAEKEPYKSDYYYKNAIICLMNDSSNTKQLVEYELIYYLFDVYKRSVHDPQNNRVFIINANKAINDYVIKNQVNLTEFVNSVSWNNGYIPFDWVTLSKDAGYDTTNWNADFGEYVAECDPYLWIDNTPPYVNATIRHRKIPLSSVNINGKYRLYQDPNDYTIFSYNDGQIKIEYKVN